MVVMVAIAVHKKNAKRNKFGQQKALYDFIACQALDFIENGIKRFDKRNGT